MKPIEELLGLSDQEIEVRTKELERSIPTGSGIEYLKAQVQRFREQPWPFMIFVAHWNPEVLREELEEYRSYDGEADLFEYVPGTFRPRKNPRGFRCLFR